MDSKEQAKLEAGDFENAIKAGTLQRSDVLDFAPLLVGKYPGRETPQDVTVFKSIGIIAQDIALGELILRRAKQDGIGTEFDPQDGTCQMPAPERAPAPSAITAQDRVAFS